MRRGGQARLSFFDCSPGQTALARCSWAGHGPLAQWPETGEYHGPLAAQADRHPARRLRRWMALSQHSESMGGPHETQTFSVRLRRGFGLSSILAALVAALGFVVPAFGFHWRTRQKLRADDNLRFLADHDSLTRLPNRRYFMAQFQMPLDDSPPLNGAWEFLL